jgi:hypothetical protein
MAAVWKLAQGGELAKEKRKERGKRRFKRQRERDNAKETARKRQRERQIRGDETSVASRPSAHIASTQAHRLHMNMCVPLKKTHHFFLSPYASPHFCTHLIHRDADREKIGPAIEKREWVGLL